MSAEKHLQLNMINRRFRPAEGDVDPVSLNHRLKDIKSSTSSSFLKHKQDLLINTVSMSTLLLFFCTLVCFVCLVAVLHGIIVFVGIIYMPVRTADNKE